MRDKYNRLITSPIIIEDAVWVGARAFINMGVTLKEGCVVGGFSYVYKDVDAWNVVSGNPSHVIKIRKIRE
jgi:putative colanic acid biosynthesis acetyltransferase WcaF